MSQSQTGKNMPNSAFQYANACRDEAVHAEVSGTVNAIHLRAHLPVDLPRGSGSASARKTALEAYKQQLEGVTAGQVSQRAAAREKRAAQLLKSQSGWSLREFVLRVDWRMLIGGEIGAGSPFPLVHAETGVPYVPERVVRHLARAGRPWAIEPRIDELRLDHLLGCPPKRGSVRVYSAFPVGRITLTWHTKTPHDALGKRKHLYLDTLPNPIPFTWLVVAAPTEFRFLVVGAEADASDVEQLIRAGAEVEGCGKCTALAMGRMTSD